MILRTAVTATVGVVLGVIQSTLLAKIIPFGIVPDLALLVLVATAWRYGSLTAEITGFLIGLSLDAMSLAPLGFHAFSYTLIGYAFGRLQDNISPGAFFLPVLAAVIATIMKYTGALLLSLVFGLNAGAARYVSLDAVWEILFNAVIAPLVFLAVSLFSSLAEGRRGGFR